MEKIDILYDHYKETVKLSLDMQKRRGNLFVTFCIFELLNFTMLLFPNEIVTCLSAYIKTQYKVGFSFNVAIIQSALWTVITYVMIRYYQTNIYIERQYGYISTLEDKIAKIINEPCFKRESDNYLDKYPMVLNLISSFYTWVIPILIIMVNGLKVIIEWKNQINSFGVLFDTLCCIFNAILTIMYLLMIHSRAKN